MSECKDVPPSPYESAWGEMLNADCRTEYHIRLYPERALFFWLAQWSAAWEWDESRGRPNPVIQ